MARESTLTTIGETVRDTVTRAVEGLLGAAATTATNGTPRDRKRRAAGRRRGASAAKLGRKAAARRKVRKRAKTRKPARRAKRA
jgi:hypothetical protein